MKLFNGRKKMAKAQLKYIKHLRSGCEACDLGTCRKMKKLKEAVYG